MKLEILYSGSFKCYKVFSLKMKKRNTERCETPKNNKNSSQRKNDKEDIEKKRR